MRFDMICDIECGVLVSAKNCVGNAVDTQCYLEMRSEFWNAKKFLQQKNSKHFEWNSVSRVVCVLHTVALTALLVILVC